MPPEVQKIVTKTPGLFRSEEPQNVAKVCAVGTKPTKTYHKSGYLVPTNKNLAVQKIGEETSGPFLDEKPKYVAKENVGDFKLIKKNHKDIKQTFEIKSEPKRMQENYVNLGEDSELVDKMCLGSAVTLKHQSLKKEYFSGDAQDRESKLVLKSTLCDVCSKTFTNRYTLKAHMKTHEEKTHICNVCQKSYSDKNILKTHLLLHSQKKSQCQVCFAFVTRMKMHMKNKHGERKLLTCTICGQDKVERKMAGHEKLCRMTEEEKAVYKECIKVKCENCPKILSNKEKLARHIQSVHSNSKIFQCKHCDHKDNRSDNMKTHVKNNHQ